MSNFKMTKGEFIGRSSIYISLSLLALTMLAAFLHVASRAVSGFVPNMSGSVYLLPKEFQINTLRLIMVSSQFLRSIRVSLLVTVLGTTLSLIVMGLAAYALSKERLMGRRFLTACFVFTILFSGGIIPTYMVIKSLGMINSLTSLIIPGAVNAYYMLILKSSFEGVPPALEESAKIDGASNFTILVRITLPVVLPTVSAVSLFLIVAFWNEYWFAMLYITRSDLKTIQIYLLGIISASADLFSGGVNSTFSSDQSPQAIRAAAIVAASLPMLILYPFVQKYFVKGVLIGSVKA